MKFYVSSYTEGFFGEGPTGAAGIALCEFDGNEIRVLEEYADSINPSFLRLVPDSHSLFAACETRAPGRLDRYDVASDGRLHLATSKTLHGGSCCYVDAAPEQGFIAGAHYGSGDVFTCRWEPDGSLGEITSEIVHTDIGPNRERQEAPHAHSVRKIPEMNVFAACDLGCDRVDFYEYCSGGFFTPAKLPTIHTPAGSGPRHTESRGDRLYVSCELSNQVLFYVCENGAYRLKQSISTLPGDFKGENTCADIHLSRDGSFLYVSNRGHDSLVRFQTEPDGTLSSPIFYPSGGRCPRNFALADTWIICANQEDGVTVLDAETGHLEARLNIPSPVCIELFNTQGEIL